MIYFSQKKFVSWQKIINQAQMFKTVEIQNLFEIIHERERFRSSLKKNFDCFMNFN